MNCVNVKKETNNSLTRWLDRTCIKITDSDFDTCCHRRRGGSIGIRDGYKIEYLKYIDIFENGEEDFTYDGF